MRPPPPYTDKEHFVAYALCVLLSQDDGKEYSGPSPGALLEPLFKRSSCSYRVRRLQFRLI